MSVMKKLTLFIVIILATFSFAQAQVSPEKDANEILAEEAVVLINIERQKHRLAPLMIDPNLRDYAAEWAGHMAQENKMSHRTNRDLLEFIEKNAMNGITENVAYTTKPWTAEDVVKIWMKSPAHRANLLRKDSRLCGVGFAWKNNRGYAVFNGAKPDVPAKGN